MPVQVEKFGKDRQRVQRIRAERLLWQDDHTWSPANVIVEVPGSSHRTLWQDSRDDRSLDIRCADFTVDQRKGFCLP